MRTQETRGTVKKLKGRAEQASSAEEHELLEPLPGGQSSGSPKGRRGK